MQNEENEGSYSHKVRIDDVLGLFRSAATFQGVECTEKGITSVLRENWRVVVVSSPVPNAFVVPTIPRCGMGLVKLGMYRSAGLVHAMGSDAGLAYVLAHELAHVLAAHGNQQIASKLLARIGQLLILALIDSSGVLVGAAEVVAYGLGKYGFELPVQRGNEMEADKLAIHINARACYSPSSGPSALKRLHEVGGVGGWAHTHPTTVQRLEQLENEKHSAGEHYDEVSVCVKGANVCSYQMTCTGGRPLHSDCPGMQTDRGHVAQVIQVCRAIPGNWPNAPSEEARAGIAKVVGSH
eukprot:scaffold234_cov406-Prasinococcus_capsulatus_cf.AAC.11